MNFIKNLLVEMKNLNNDESNDVIINQSILYSLLLKCIYFKGDNKMEKVNKLFKNALELNPNQTFVWNQYVELMLIEKNCSTAHYLLKIIQKLDYSNQNSKLLKLNNQFITHIKLAYVKLMQCHHVLNNVKLLKDLIIHAKSMIE
jgi:GH35 family endo-1,4-beta-xylanase